MFVGFQRGVYWGFPNIRRIGASKEKARKPVAPQSELGHVLSLELKLQFVRNQGDELRIGGLAFCIGHGVTEEALEGIQIASVPGDLDGVTDSTFDTGWGGAEGFGYLGVQYFCDGVACLTARWGASKRENLLRCL